MADTRHLRILKRGVDSWNAWRRRTGVEPELSEAEAPGAGLSGADLHGVRLDGADLCQADLSQADLRGARLDGAQLAGCDLSGADLEEAELEGADLQGADLSGANLEAACLTGAQLLEADLSQASLVSAMLDAADLGAADLKLCNLRDADLRQANLRRVDLRASELASAHLGGADLAGAQLAGARLRDTLLVDLDLCAVKGLSSVKHLGPSSVATDTLARTAAGLPAAGERLRQVEAFYRGAGVEEHLIAYYRHRCGGARGLAPCYVVHHPADRGCASLVYEQLLARGVNCWLDPGGHAAPSVRAARARGVKVVLCVSGSALNRLWAHDRPSFAGDRASAGVREVLMVVDLDGSLSAGWGGAEADRLRRLVVADFSGLAGERTTLEAELEKIVEGLAR